MKHQIDSTPEFVENAYKKIEKNVELARKRLRRPLTLVDKILLGHLHDPEHQELVPGSYLELKPDRVAMQDATAQMALLQFSQCGRKSVAVPATVHCDHLIRAYSGAEKDLAVAREENAEVYEFLRTASNKYGIGFWKPGAGIIHQIVFEHYAFPGGMMIGTDSHTPNSGGLGMFASGVGGADAVDVLAGFPWEVLLPTTVGVKLIGSMAGWTAPKDVILALLGILTVKGGTNRVIEYFGPGTRSISCTGKATITNMGAELGATTSIFPFDERMATYLRGTERAKLADLAEKYRHLLASDPEVDKEPEKYYDKIIEIDLSSLEPHIVGPHTPDLARPVSKLKDELGQKGYRDELSAVLVGSCTNSSYEDLCRSADVAIQARAHGARSRVPLLISPGSEQIYQTIQRDGQMAELEAIGATLLTSSCGPCIGQWKRDGFKADEVNSIVTSFNRNFPARNDGNPSTACFIASPEITVAYGLAGRLSIDPTKDEIKTAGGTSFRLSPPKPAPDMPAKGFVKDVVGFEAPPDDSDAVQVRVAPASDRLQLLDPFPAWDGKDYTELPLLVKAKGKCTTDHISPAGKWLKYRGHLDNISNNMLLGAVNAFTGQAGKGVNQLTGEQGLEIPKIARGYKAKGLRWIVVGDENYGEGSSREHAAMSPRLLGAAAVITRSFARIHESNLKKQGILPLTFVSPSDYDRIRETDRISLVRLSELAPGKEVLALLHHKDGKKDEIRLRHTLNSDQIVWFKAGSALNVLRGKA